MQSREVPRNQWPQFLDAFSQRHRAWLATVEQWDATGMLRREPRPLAAVTPERDGRRVSAIEIYFAEDSDADAVRIDRPAALRVQQTVEGADRALEIVDADGGCTRIGFLITVRPEMLDGILPGEV